MKFLNNIDLQKNEIQNFRVQNLASAPLNPVLGQHYFNTVDNKEYVWNGTAWIDALSQGNYTFQNGLTELSDSRTVEVKLAAGEHTGNVKLTADENGLAASVADASNSAKGIIQIATDEEATAGTDETKAVNPKQVKSSIDAVKTELGERIDTIEGSELTAGDLKATAPLKYDQETTTFSVDLDEAPTTESEKLVNSGAVYKAIDDAKTEVKGQITTDVTAAKTELKAEIDKKADITALDDYLKTADLKATDPVKYDADTKTISVTLDETIAAKGAGLATTGTIHTAIEAAKTEITTAVDGKLDKNEPIEGGTHTKITYDENGLVTAGADLTAADIPALTLDKISDVTATAAELNILAGNEVTSEDLTKLHEVTLTSAEINALKDVTTNLDKKLDKNTDIEAGTHTKITYDAKGLVTKGEDLTAEDIPDLTLDKITDVTATAEELNYVSSVTSAIQTQLDNKATKAEVTALDDKFILATEKGNANGVATLGEDGKVPSTQLPSYVDDVVELVTVGTEPEEGTEGDVYYNTEDNKLHTYTGEAWDEGVDPEAGKIYVTKDTNMSYRWGGTTLVQIGADKLKGYHTTITGDNDTTQFTINHDLGTRNVVFEIYDETTYEKVYVQVIHTSTTALNIIFAQAPTSEEKYHITVLAVD